jgi:lipopolysaccharide transport system ATP-binding protein
MADSIIKVEDLSKRFVISHEEQVSHNSFRDAVTQSLKRTFSFGKGTAKKSVSREEFWALKDLNFEIKAGDRVGIIGRNGAGKSTLLKILSRITEPTAGRVTINGRVASLLEVGTGFHPELTGRENIFLNGAILGMSRAEIRKKFDEIVAFAEIERFLDTPVKRYSSGMYVRLAFAVAAHLEPEILIVDEVLAVGDAQFQKKCLGKMEEVSKNEGRTVLFVSHNMGVIAQLCQRAIMLKNGGISSIGLTKDIIDFYVSSQSNSKNEYLISEERSQKKLNFFTNIFTSNLEGERTSDFLFTDHIVLNFKFILGSRIPNLQIGIGLNDKYQNRILTALKPIDFFSINDKGLYEGSMQLPNNIIAPNQYSFAFAIWTKTGQVFDFVDNVSLIKIHDSGTDLALYEGGDHGCIVLNPEWSNGKIPD